MRDLAELKLRVREFVAERDWDRFHSPKNLAMALSVEASETKIAANAKKYPAARVRGQSRKYDEY